MSGEIGYRVEDGVAWLEIRRENRLNALGLSLLSDLHSALDDARRDRSVRAVVLSGAGARAFCAGADIREMDALDETAAHEFVARGHALASAIEGPGAPVIAAVNGFALGGGCELAMACDLVAADEAAQFALPEIHLALIPGWGGTQRLARRVGYGRAREMILTGRRVAAAEALAWGLCDRLAPSGQARDVAGALAGDIAARDPAAVAAARAALRASDGEPEQGLTLERRLFLELFLAPARSEATRAFLERSARR